MSGIRRNKKKRRSHSEPIRRPGKVKNLSGKKFGMLTAIRIVGADKHFRKIWLCKCKCGGEAEIMVGNLTSGNSESCGCQKNRIKHGLRHKRAYRIWAHMLSRCRKKLKNYGGRGISVCSRWRNFELFYKDMGDPPTAKHSIDRFPNNNGNYEPGNCRWATAAEQNKNKRTTVLLTHDGVTMCLIDWAREIGISQTALRKRIKRWKDNERIFKSVI